MRGSRVCDPRAYARGSPDAQGRRSRAAFVAAGAGVRKDARPGVVDNVNVAPTIARLLGIDLPGVVGKPMDAILDEMP